MFSAKNLFFGKRTGGYQISRSLRFRSSASAYLSRTPSTTIGSSQQKLTYSFWVKRGALSSNQDFLTVGTTAADFFYLGISSSDKLTLQCYNSSVQTARLTTTQVFRDPSAWYHILVVIDTTSATSTITGSSTDRLRLYINGVQVSSFSTTAVPPLSQNLYINNTQIHYIGRASLSASEYLDGYLAEVNFIDGQALTPSSFGENDATTGVWKPKAYTGTYGTNGFYLKFSDNTALTTAGGGNTGIGKDFSGNTNYWATNNISITAGVTYDSMIDTPTPYDDGGNGVGNYAVLNPLDKGSIFTLSAANLTGDYSGAATDSSVFSSIAFDAGSSKFYAEFTLTAISLATSDVAGVGIADVNTLNSANISTAGTAVIYLDSGSKVVNGTTSAFGASWTTNDVIGVYVNQGTITFYKNGTSQGNAATSVSGTYKFVIRGRSGASRTFTIAANFGQRPYSNTPSGFKALNTQNLPTPTIAAGGSYMNISLYTGNGTSISVTNPGGFQPDFVWVKKRSAAGNNVLFDAVRGAAKYLISDATLAEGTDVQTLSAFNSSGFSYGNEASGNANSATFVGWQWKGGNGTVSNTSGTITSTVSANVTAGFSVVTYTGTGANATVGHGLGVAPNLLIGFKRSGAANHPCWHSSFAGTDFILLNSTAAKYTTPTTVFNGAPDATVFKLGTDTDLNGSGATNVMYCFAAVSGYSAFGSYTGNGSADGPFVFTGFRPRYVLLKRTDAIEDWTTYDTARELYNVEGQYLIPNSSAAEPGGTTPRIDILSNGFKLRNSGQSNTSGGTYIYAAFCENPLKYSLAR